MTEVRRSCAGSFGGESRAALALVAAPAPPPCLCQTTNKSAKGHLQKGSCVGMIAVPFSLFCLEHDSSDIMSQLWLAIAIPRTHPQPQEVFDCGWALLCHGAAEKRGEASRNSNHQSTGWSRAASSKPTLHQTSHIHASSSCQTLHTSFSSSCSSSSSSSSCSSSSKVFRVGISQVYDTNPMFIVHHPSIFHRRHQPVYDTHRCSRHKQMFIVHHPSILHPSE